MNRTLVYDNLGRPINTRTDITSGPSFASAVSYDSITGRVDTQTYPTGLQVGYSYTAGAGALEKLTLKTAANVTPLPATVGGTEAAPKTLPINTVLAKCAHPPKIGHFVKLVLIAHRRGGLSGFQVHVNVH